MNKNKLQFFAPVVVVAVVYVFVVAVVNEVDLMLVTYQQKVQIE